VVSHTQLSAGILACENEVKFWPIVLLEIVVNVFAARPVDREDPKFIM
jgi:hypothetical protein